MELVTSPMGTAGRASNRHASIPLEQPRRRLALVPLATWPRESSLSLCRSRPVNSTHLHHSDPTKGNAHDRCRAPKVWRDFHCSLRGLPRFGHSSLRSASCIAIGRSPAWKAALRALSIPGHSSLRSASCTALGRSPAWNLLLRRRFHFGSLRVLAGLGLRLGSNPLRASAGLVHRTRTRT